MNALVSVVSVLEVTEVGSAVLWLSASSFISGASEVVLRAAAKSPTIPDADSAELAIHFCRAAAAW